MAGSERSGYGVATASLLEHATVIVTPTEATAPRAVKDVTGFWEALGGRVSLLDPATHDRVVAAISHLPHLVACVLVEATRRYEPDALGFAARGFRDTTRIAAADPQMWQEIFEANRDALLGSVRAFRAALAEVEARIGSADAGALRQCLADVKAVRDGLR
jgi:prephenate dehydrogenase